MTVRVSVVVPTCRRAQLLDRCLSALLAQDLEAAAYEVIVADDAASGETKRQVEKWARLARPALVYIPVRETHGPAAARNAGWRMARGEIIAFTDDDCLPDPAWLRAGTAALADGAAAAWGRIRMPLPHPPTDYQRNEAGLEQAEFVTANCFCRRDALEAVDGFDERFTMAWREDADLCQGISLIVMDIVTSRQANCHNEIMRVTEAAEEYHMTAETSLYRVAYRPVVRRDKEEIDLWPAILAVGEILPLLPLRLAGDLFVPVDFEATYTDACRRLRLR